MTSASTMYYKQLSYETRIHYVNTNCQMNLISQQEQMQSRCNFHIFQLISSEIYAEFVNLLLLLQSNLSNNMTWCVTLKQTAHVT